VADDDLAPELWWRLLRAALARHSDDMWGERRAVDDFGWLVTELAPEEEEPPC
jgi:hypothetical protein